MNSRTRKVIAVTEQAFGQAEALGVSLVPARQDHTHGTPADPNDEILANISGTATEITVTDNGDGTITLSLPTAIKLDGATASRLLATDGDKLTASVTDLTDWIAGTANRVTVGDDADGTVTLSGPQDIHSGASPTFAGLTNNGLTSGQVPYAGASSLMTDTNLYTDASDFWWVGAGTGIPYGSMYADDIAETVAVAASGTFYEVDGGNFTLGQGNLIALDGDYRLQASKAGIYLANWSLAVDANAANQYIEGTVAVNGTEVMEAVSVVDITVAQQQATIGGTCLLSLAADDYVSLAVSNETSTQDIEVTHGNLTLIMVGGIGA